MFRDSRGVVHTVSSVDPLDDLPQEAAAALGRALLRPCGGDLGGALERCEAVRDLLDRWQDAFFAALPVEVDLDEEARWAAEAGLSLDDVESQWEDEDDEWDEEQSPGQLGLEEIDLTELAPFDDEPFPLGPPEQPVVLGEETVGELEVALLLLPLRVRLEALVAAAALVDGWTDLMADHEKCLGHLVLRHGMTPQARAHEVLADEHAALHADGPSHR